MTPNKTTEQPIPGWYQDFIKECTNLVEHNPINEGFKSGLQQGLITAFRKLHSLSPSPVGEAGDNVFPIIEELKLLAGDMICGRDQERVFKRIAVLSEPGASVGTRLTIQGEIMDAMEVLSKRIKMACKLYNEQKEINAALVKSPTPAGQKGPAEQTFTQDRSKPLPFICSTHDLEYDGECPECIAEQPAHVPDPKGEIPTDMMLFIINESHKAVHEKDTHNFPEDVGKMVGVAMYHKMREEVKLIGTKFEEYVNGGMLYTFIEWFNENY